MFTQKHAKAIAKKLDCVLLERAKHVFAELHVGDKLIVSFGIRRASRDVSHSFIPQQLHLKQKECWELHDCTLSKEQYLEILREKGKIAD